MKAPRASVIYTAIQWIRRHISKQNLRAGHSVRARRFQLAWRVCTFGLSLFSPSQLELSEVFVVVVDVCTSTLKYSYRGRKSQS